MQTSSHVTREEAGVHREATCPQLLSKDQTQNQKPNPQMPVAELPYRSAPQLLLDTMGLILGNAYDLLNF